MPRMPRVVACLFVVVLCACSGPSHTLGLPSAEVAILEGRDQGFDLIPLGLEGWIRIVSIDGVELEASSLRGAPTSVELLPGAHRVGISYSFFVDGSPGPRGTTTLDVDVEAGKRYRVEPRFDADPAAFELVDVTAGG